MVSQCLCFKTDHHQEGISWTVSHQHMRRIKVELQLVHYSVTATVLYLRCLFVLRRGLYVVLSVQELNKLTMLISQVCCASP